MMVLETTQRYEKDTSVLGNLTSRWFLQNEADKTSLAFRQLFGRYAPWTTFGTLTVKPGYGERAATGVGAAAMGRLTHKFFSRHSMRKIKYFWCLEKHLPEEYGGKGGTHAHFVTQEGDDGTKDFWRAQWDWWHNKKGYGRFRTEPVQGEHTLKLAAYLSKYLSKDSKTSDWGMARFAQLRTEPRAIKGHSGTCLPTVVEGSQEERRLLRETLNWSRKFRPAGSPYIYRKPTREC